jgi:serine/threonine protein kinase/formylglycine-generating enzyme required for sulfatase activity
MAARSVSLEETTLVPKRLGRYAVVRQLGSGGFAKVLLAHDAELDRDVAIKVPRRDRFKSAESLRTFLDEARTVARLRHPGIVSVFDVGMHDDTPFIVLEYIRGRTLSHLLEHDRLSFPGAAKMAAEIGDALAHAHDLGFVHRDIKPLNILLDGDDCPHVADFGLAIRHRELIQNDEEVVGTTHYMAPEQVRAENHRIDGRTDLWALGVVLYRLLVGRRPFHGSNSDEVARAILATDPVPLRQIDPQVPEELERICLRCLCRQMSDRYRNARDLVDDLTAWLRLVGEDSGSVSTRRRSLVAISPTATVVPRGLRSFEPEDADFFLRLIPGPRDRAGLPISVGVWKQRIEARDVDQTFRVGVLYGPSGCGKSSLVKAGLLPRLDADVVPIYLEATSHGTEERLLKTLHRQLDRLPAGLELPAALRQLRERPELRGGRKVLVVLDQFEQWLVTWNSAPAVALVEALRHCDGAEVQCLLLVRDDFWLGFSRFMRHLEVTTEEGVNGMLVDSFDAQHARRVLHELGAAYGRLPASESDLSGEQVAFMEQAVDELAESGRLYPVRLAVFVEMVKSHEWAPGTLAELGGTEGVGAAFLERSVGLQAPAPRRQHERAARNVLAALLPTGGQIKRSVRTRSQLLEAAECGDARQDFDELLHLLEVELRLLTAVQTADEESGTAATENTAEPAYQLTHDFLVPSIREWLQRQLRGTRQGRAQLLLEQQSTVWDSHPSPRYLPSLLEWIGLRLGTRRRDWNDAQRRMMDAAAGRIARRLALGGGILLVVMLSALAVYQGVQAQQNEIEANLLVTELQNAPSPEVPEVVANLQRYGAWVDPQLKAQADDASLPTRQRIRAAVALLPRDPTRLPQLVDRLLSDQTAPDDFLVLRQALLHHREPVLARLDAALDDLTLARPVRFRAACALAGLAPESARWNRLSEEVAASLLQEPAPYASVWIEALRPVASHLLQPLAGVLSQTTSLEPARVGALALWTLENERADLLAGTLIAAEGSRHRAIVEILQRDREQSLAQVRRQLQRLVDNEPAADRLQRERGLASLVIALYELGDQEPLRQYAALAAEPGIRARIVHDLGPECIDVNALLPLLEEPGETSPLRNVALLACWRHRNEPLREDVRVQLCQRLVEIHESDPSPEAHAAAGLLLRSLDPDFLTASDERLAGTKPVPARAWFVSAAGQTMVVLPPSPRPAASDPPSRQLPPSFAISATEVTFHQFQSLVPQHDQEQENVAPDMPACYLHLVHVAAFCNELSRLDGIPPDEWCYPQGDELTVTNCDPLPGFQQKLGYRLPTSEEWEFACRCGSTTTRFVGEDASLLEHYAWDRHRSRSSAQPVARLLPNPWGLFDIYGNLAELCLLSGGDSGPRYVRRGESCLVPLEAMHSASESRYGPRTLTDYLGIRVARTLPRKAASRD